MKRGRYMSNTLITKITDKVKMADEDRAYFKEGVKTLCGTELIFAGNVINDKDLRKRFESEDLAFMNKELGRQAGAIWKRLLRALKKHDFAAAEEIIRGKRGGSSEEKESMEAPFAPMTVHLYLTEVLDDNKSEEREKGMIAGKKLLGHCSYILIGDKYGRSSGMIGEINLAEKLELIRLYERDGKLYYAGSDIEAGM